jgi:hypothetical protein
VIGVGGDGGERGLVAALPFLSRPMNAVASDSEYGTGISGMYRAISGSAQAVAIASASRSSGSLRTRCSDSMRGSTVRSYLKSAA